MIVWFLFLGNLISLKFDLFQNKMSIFEMVRF